SSVAFESRMRVGPIGIRSSPAPGGIRANRRRYREPAIDGKDAVPLPTANQLIYHAARSAAERFAVPERQLIAEVRAELVQEAEGGRSFVQVPVKSIHGCRILIIGAIDEVRRIAIQHLSTSIAGLERQPAARALEQREIHRMVVARADIEPALGGTEQRVRTRSHRDVQGSLRDDAPLGCRENSTCLAARR